MTWQCHVFEVLVWGLMSFMLRSFVHCCLQVRLFASSSSLCCHSEATDDLNDTVFVDQLLVVASAASGPSSTGRVPSGSEFGQDKARVTLLRTSTTPWTPSVGRVPSGSEDGQGTVSWQVVGGHSGWQRLTATAFNALVDKIITARPELPTWGRPGLQYLGGGGGGRFGSTCTLPFWGQPPPQFHPRRSVDPFVLGA